MPKIERIKRRHFLKKKEQKRELERMGSELGVRSHSLLQGFVTLPRIVVDMGAVKFVANGADIMRPGVTHADDGIQEGSVVAIVDETHGKPLAVGTAIMSTQEILAADKGKVALSKHHINDDLWTFSRG
ncbi:MAG: PUA domain-containing protein [Candidatus Thorarchaeota archaeon]|jgi:PUA domain protein